MKDQEEEKKIDILYVDDEIGNLTAFKATFRRIYNVFIAESADEGIRILDNNNIEIINIPMSLYERPEKNQVIMFLKTTIDKTKFPIFVHCQSGRDITGTMIAIYRTTVDGLTIRQAYQEAKKKKLREKALLCRRSCLRRKRDVLPLSTRRCTQTRRYSSTWLCR